MKIFTAMLMAATLALSGCESLPRRSPQELVANNPSTICIREVAGRPSLQALRAKIGFNNDERLAMPLHVRTNDSLPTSEDRVAIAEYWSARAECITREGDYATRNYPPQVVPILADDRLAISRALTALYESKLTFAGYIAAAEEASQETKRRLAQADVDQQRAQIDASTRRSAAVNSALQGLALQQQIQTQQQLQMQLNRPSLPTTTNCIRTMANQMRCTTY